VYEGVGDEQPVQLYGETGAQSSILPAFDAAMGIEHKQGW
jgi:indoleamine 2,3-dioxygenase